MKPLLIISYLILCVGIGASADALDIIDLKMWSHSLEAIELLLLIVGATIFDVRGLKIIAWVLAYTFFRIAFFDLTWNFIVGVPWYYFGNNSLWDWFFSQQHPQGVVILRILSLITAVAVVLKTFHPRARA